MEGGLGNPGAKGSRTYKGEEGPEEPSSVSSRLWSPGEVPGDYLSAGRITPHGELVLGFLVRPKGLTLERLGVDWRFQVRDWEREGSKGGLGSVRIVLGGLRLTTQGSQGDFGPSQTRWKWSNR